MLLLRCCESEVYVVVSERCMSGACSRVCVIGFATYPAMCLRVRSAHEVRSVLQCVAVCCSVLQ